MERVEIVDLRVGVMAKEGKGGGGKGEKLVGKRERGRNEFVLLSLPLFFFLPLFPLPSSRFISSPFILSTLNYKDQPSLSA